MAPDSKQLRLKVLEGKKKDYFLRAQNLFDLISQIEKDQAAYSNFLIRYQTFSDTRSKFNDVVDEINELELSLNKDAEPNFQALSAFDDLFGAIVIAYDKISNTGISKPTTSNRVPSIDQSDSHAQLPTIKIKPFSGKVQDWPEFRDLFKAVILENKQLSEAQKYHYLRMSLEQPALKIISSFPVSAEHFQSALKALEERFENKRLLASHFFEELFYYEKPPPHPTIQTLQNFLSRFNDAVVGLGNLQIQDKSDLIILNLALRRLDHQSRKAFEKEHVNTEFPKYKDLVAFIKNQLKILELTSSDISSPKRPVNDTNRPKFPSRVLLTQTPNIRNLPHPNLPAPRPSPPWVACPLCQAPHALYKCAQFIQMPVDQRSRKVQQLNACLNCLSLTHSSDRCRSNFSCYKCGRSHHTMIHYDPKVKPAPTPEVQYTRNPIPSTSKIRTSNTSFITNDHSFINADKISLNQTQVVLGTVLLHIRSNDGNPLTVRALIDPASTRSCITERCVSRLKLPICPAHQPFTGLGGMPVATGKGVSLCVLTPRDREEPCLKTEAVVIPHIIGPTPPSPLPSNIVKNYSNFPLADPSFGDPGQIDFLLGADIFMSALCSKPNHNLAKGVLNTVFGSVIIGPLPSKASSTCLISTQFDPSANLSNALTRFWEIEEVTPSHITNPDDDICEAHFLSTHRRHSDGRYIVRLPFKNDNLTFPESHEVAVNRFLSLERRLHRNQKLKSSCFSFLHEYAELKHMEPAIQPPKYFLPYFCVHNPHSITTPVRVVFDGSAKLSHLSLNQVLYSGPKLQKEIPDVLLNFRLHQLVFSCDIVKMYRQILLAEEDREFTNILFREKPDFPLRTYQLNTVTYGLAPSAWQAQRVLLQLVHDEGDKFPAASRVIQQDTFVDDIITGADCLTDLCTLEQQLVQLLRAGGFELSKWISNSKDFLEHIKSSHSRPLVINDAQDQTVKILGIRWEPAEDVFSYQVVDHSKPQHVTKRTILGFIARIFDPLGFLAPLTFMYKCFMQTLWKTNLGWDDSLPLELEMEWNRLINGFNLLSRIRLPRCILPKSYQSLQIIGFSDASERGYGCVLYLRASGDTGQTRVSLLVAKSKVAPLKGSTIPRLELAGALLLSRALTAVGPLISKLPHCETYLFTDSTIVLSWLHKPPHTLKMFVANRVAEILEHTRLDFWRHISTHDNPADIVSRGLEPPALCEATDWFQGPAWLLPSPSEWPQPLWSPIPSENLPELKSIKSISLLNNPEINSESTVTWMDRYSTLNKIQRIRAYGLRFIYNCRVKNSDIRRSGVLTVAELRSALYSCISEVQKNYFAPEIASISQNKLKSTRLLPLSPFLDLNNLLRVGGRLKHSAIEYSAKHPLLLPKHSHFTHLLIDHTHKCYLHAGPRTLKSILQRKYWILSAHSVIRQRIRLCLTCSRFVATTPSPLMADLPQSRVSPSRPFYQCGVDIAGPYVIKESTRRNSRSYKAYFALFICMATKAVHLEALTSLSSEAFIASLNRFVSRRGLPYAIYCDQGSNFRGAARELKEISEFLRENSPQQNISQELHKKEIKIKFICPKAPFMGGVWESNIKNVKFHYRRVVGNQILTLEEFCTVLARIEAVLNSRPLCDISTTPNELEALTPGHFLTGAPLVAVPDYPLEEVPLNRLSRWQLVSRLSQHFWQRWASEYLLTLQQRAKWFSTDSPNLKPGQLVWIKEDGAPPLSFPLGRIQQAEPNPTDGIVRIATVKTAHGLLRRPVRKLAPLFLSE